MSSEKEGQKTLAAEAVSAPLNTKNYLNLVFYILNIYFTYGIGSYGWFGSQTNGELSAIYQTLVTPKDVAFAIWGIIFLFQGIFACVQLLPRFRDTDMVQDGVSYYYVLVSTFQIAWSFAFGYNMIGTALVFIVLIWLSLASIVYSQYCIKSNNHKDNSGNSTLSPATEFWLLQFPFDIHCGWLVAATALNASVVAVKMEVTPDTEIAMSLLSLCVLYMVSFWVTFALSDAGGPNITIALSISWAANWIHHQLLTPKNSISTKFDENTIVGIRNAYKIVSIVVLAQVVLRVVYSCAKKLCFPDKDTTRNKDAMKYALELSLDNEYGENEMDGLSPLSNNGKRNSPDEEKGLIH